MVERKEDGSTRYNMSRRTLLPAPSSSAPPPPAAGGAFTGTPGTGVGTPAPTRGGARSSSAATAAAGNAADDDDNDGDNNDNDAVSSKNRNKEAGGGEEEEEEETPRRLQGLEQRMWWQFHERCREMRAAHAQRLGREHRRLIEEHKAAEPLLHDECVCEWAGERALL